MSDVTDEPSHSSALPVSARQRPIGVTVLAGLSAITSAFLFLGGLYLLVSSAEAFKGTALLMGAVMFAFFVALYAACAVGLWRLSNSARWLVIVLAALLGVRGFPVASIVAAPIIIYLSLKRVRAAFMAPANAVAPESAV